MLHWFDALAVIGAAFVGGAMLGSFLNVVIHRLPKGETVVFGGSRCPWCRARVRPWDNIPILGWLVLRGRCRDCGGPISPWYPLVEAGCGLIAAVIAALAVACAV